MSLKKWLRLILKIFLSWNLKFFMDFWKFFSVELGFDFFKIPDEVHEKFQKKFSEIPVGMFRKFLRVFVENSHCSFTIFCKKLQKIYTKSYFVGSFCKNWVYFCVSRSVSDFETFIPKFLMEFLKNFRVVIEKFQENKKKKLKKIL